MEFKKTTVKNSIQKFKDYEKDLIQSDLNTFDDRLDIFIHFCITDEIFSKIDLQLSHNPNVNVLEWYKERTSQMGSFGSAKLKLPLNEDDRLSLMYQILKALSEKKISQMDFFVNFFATGSSQINTYIVAFIDAIVIPLCRGLNYKIKDIEETIFSTTSEKVPASILQIINAGDNFIQQISQGNKNVQTTKITSQSVELEKLIAKLKETIKNELVDEKEKSDAINIVNGVEKELTSDTPNKIVVKTLLNALPIIDSISSIISSILALI